MHQISQAGGRLKKGSISALKGSRQYNFKVPVWKEEALEVAFEFPSLGQVRVQVKGQHSRLI